MTVGRRRRWRMWCATRENLRTRLSPISTPTPSRSFRRIRSPFVYGGKWKQRYFTKNRDDYYPVGRLLPGGTSATRFGAHTTFPTPEQMMKALAYCGSDLT